MQHNLPPVFLGRLDTRCSTYFAENYTLAMVCESLNVDHIQKEQSSQSPGGREGADTSGSSGKGIEVLTA